MTGIRGDVVRIAREVAFVLNRVTDDDERDDLHGLFERTLNDELYQASMRRTSTVTPLRRGADVIDLHTYSRRV